MKILHLTLKAAGWQLKEQGSRDAFATFATKREALDMAEEIVGAETGSLILHNRDGTFAEKRTYPRSAEPRDYSG
jgi:hypothetical protein